MKAASAYEVFFGPQNRVVTLKLIQYSLMMVLIPLGTFYFSYYVFFKMDPAMLGWSGILAVIATNCVIFAYIKMAFDEDDRYRGTGTGTGTDGSQTNNNEKKAVTDSNSNNNRKID